MTTTAERTEPGDTVRLRGTDILGAVVETRNIFTGLSVAWRDRGDKAPTWHAWSAVELISKS